MRTLFLIMNLTMFYYQQICGDEDVVQGNSPFNASDFIQPDIINKNIAERWFRNMLEIKLHFSLISTRNCIFEKTFRRYILQRSTKPRKSLKRVLSVLHLTWSVPLRVCTREHNTLTIYLVNN